MALIRANSGSGGNPITLDDLSFTGKTLIHTINVSNPSWTADRDCVMAVNMKGASGMSPIIYFDGQVAMWGTNSNDSVIIGFTSVSATTPTTYGVFIPKGTPVGIRATYGTYNVVFYA